MTFYLKIWHALRVHKCLVCFANILGVLCLDQKLLSGDEFISYIYILQSFVHWPNSETQTHFQTWHLPVRLLPHIKGTQLAWMPYSTQFCHQKKFSMEWTLRLFSLLFSTVSKVTLHDMRKLFISKCSEIKFEVFFTTKKLWDALPFFFNNGNIACKVITIPLDHMFAKEVFVTWNGKIKTNTDGLLRTAAVSQISDSINNEVLFSIILRQCGRDSIISLTFW